MTQKLLFFALLLASCKVEEGDAREYQAPAVGVPAAAPAPGCEARDPAWCAAGYYRDWVDDPALVWCMHIEMCPVVERPCVQGEPEGDPGDFVRCWVQTTRRADQ